MAALGFSPSDFYYLLPELILTAGALLLLLVNVIVPRRDDLLFGLSMGTLAVSALVLLSFAGVDIVISRGLLAIDGFALFFKLIFLVSAGLTLMMSAPYLRVEGVRAGEYYFLILCATLGMMFMASGIDLITLFIGLETMAVAFYILAGYLKPSHRSNEAAVKYFLLGAFSLGILLYGMSIVYGMTGSTRLDEIAVALAAQDRSLVLSLGMILLAAGMGFKIAAVPFHMWAPDVYEGRADAGDGVPVGRVEGGLVRDAAAHLHRGAGAADPRLAGGVRLPRRRDDDGGQHRRDHAEQHEADARLLVDRARRLRADRRGGGHRARRRRRRWSTSGSTCSCSSARSRSSRCCGGATWSATSSRT